MKKCSVCNTARSLEAFTKSKKSADGFRDECRHCNASRAKAWREGNPEKAKQAVGAWRRNNVAKVATGLKTWRAKNPVAIAECRRRNWASALVSQARNRAQHSGYECTISTAWVAERFQQQSGKCFWLGVDLVPSGTPYAPWKPSLDRLDNEKGYTQDNVVLSSRFANHARNGMDADAFRLAVDALRASLATSLVAA